MLGRWITSCYILVRLLKNKVKITFVCLCSKRKEAICCADRKSRLFRSLLAYVFSHAIWRGMTTLNAY
jgi:hypothetical protein